jgi:hypothetical protein
MATILTNYKVVPATRDNASEDVAREHILKLMAGSNASMAVHFAEPEDLWIKLTERTNV